MVPLVALALSSSLTLPAGAAPCPIRDSRIRATVPMDRASDAPADASIGVWWSNYDPQPEFLSVRVDGQEIDGQAETSLHQESASSWSGLSLFTPREELPLGARVEVQFSAPSAGGGDRFSFRVGKETAPRPIAAPSHLNLIMKEDPQPSADGCHPARRTFWGSVGVPAEADPNDWLVIYRATPDGALDEFFTVIGTADMAPLDWKASSTELDRDLQAECFTVVQITASGERVSSADATCATDPGDLSAELPIGCAAGAPLASSSLLLPLIAALRRRRAAEAPCASSSCSPPSPRRCRASSEA